MSTLAIIWRAADLLFATGIDSILEVLPPVAWSPTPAVPAWIRGLFCYRDRLIPLVDVSRLLGGPPTTDRMVNRVLVVRRSDGAGTVEWPVGLWVESVQDLARLDFSVAGNHPGFATQAGRFLGPVVQTQWGQVQLVRPAEIFSPEQTAVLADRLREAAA